jgi:arylsulfatase
VGGVRNVVLLTYDSLRYDHCSFAGYERPTTPNLDALAAEGTVYENAVSTAARTNPSMSGALTGDPLVWRGEVADADHSRGQLERNPPVAERFRERGYETAAFCPNAYASSYYGFDAGFDTFEDFLFGEGMYRKIFDGHLGDSGLYTLARNLRNYVRKQEAFKTWDTYVDDIEAWADGAEEPFFCWAFSLDTHFPYIAPRGDRRWGNLPAMYYYNYLCNRLLTDPEPDVSERTKRAIIDMYDDSVRFADRFLGELRERLAEYDPVYVVHADHGEAFFEHGPYGHFHPSLYEENVHVPLVVSAGEGTVEKPVSLTDLPGILTEAAEGGFDYPGHEWVVSTTHDEAFGEHGPRDLVAVRTTEWKYIVTLDGEHRSDELYHLPSDPDERENRVGEGLAIEGELAALAERRLSHERDVLDVRERAERIDFEERRDRTGGAPA